MHNIVIGDLVQCIASGGDPHNKLVQGQTYTVRWVDKDGLIWVDIAWRLRGGYLPQRFKEVDMATFKKGDKVMIVRTPKNPKWSNSWVSPTMDALVGNGKVYTVESYSAQHGVSLVDVMYDYPVEALERHKLKPAKANVKTDTKFSTGLADPDNSQGAGLKYDGGKVMFRALTRGLALPLKAVAAVLTYGASKYKIDSWQTVPQGAERYEDALDRHLNAWKSGEENDDESGLHHLAHAACNVLFMLWFEMTAKPNRDYTKFNDPTKLRR